LPGRRISGGTITREALVQDNRWERKYELVPVRVYHSKRGDVVIRICRRSVEKPRAAPRAAPRIGSLLEVLNVKVGVKMLLIYVG
jgi:hypothetical protein